MHLGKGFREEELAGPAIRHLQRLARQVRGDVLRMSQLAGGRPVGGALSMVDMLVTLAAAADIDPSDPQNPKRDRIVVAHEEGAPTFYATLGRMDFFDLDDAVCLYRKAGSIFEGKLDRSVPGVEWCCGGPGQGLSAACGLALAARWNGHKPNIFVVMSDDEQQSGQVAEARRFAKKYRLNNITALIDGANLQVAGKTSEIMPQNLKYEYIADGWDVIEINGHDPAELYQAVRRASQIQSTPVLVLANTAMGAGVSFIENQVEFLSRGLTPDEFEEAMRELGESSDLSEAADYRSAFGDFDIEFEAETPRYYEVRTGGNHTYTAKERLTNIQAFGNALAEVGELNRQGDNPLVVFDCAHAQSLALTTFAHKNHDRFLQCGLGIHAAASVASAMSGEGVASILVDYGVRSLDEVYNQLRLADVNRANLKIVATHLGLDAGSDGKSFHCLDYMGLAANLHGFKLILPADPNQTDRAFRYILRQPGNWILGLGRSETPVITGPKGSSPLFGGNYEFDYGQIVPVRPGENGVLLTTGQMLPKAIEAWAILNREHLAPALLHVSAPLALDDSENPELQKWLRKGRVITYEDHNVATGLGSRVAGIIARKGISSRLLTLGVNRYALSGDSEDLYRWMGLGVEALVEKARKFLKK